MVSEYKVEIEKISGSGDSDGFVDHTRIEYYLEEGETASLESSTNKKRANYRYRKIINFLHLMGNMTLYDQDAVSGTAEDAPASFEFKIRVQHGDPVLVQEDGEYLGEDAIVHAIASALALEYAQVGDVLYDTARLGGVQTIDVGSLGDVETIKESITVTKL